MRLHALPFAALLALALGGCPKDEKECDSGQTLCFGSCVDAQTDDAACGAGCIPCAAGASCVGGVCLCPSGQTECYGACVDLQSDDLHCGACDLWCSVGTCSLGTCVCDAGADVCTGPGAQCVDLDTHTSDCGTCRHACDAYEYCVLGVCTCVAPDLVCSGGCVPAATDEANCGACGNVCATGATCTGGSCACPGTTQKCGTAPGACVDVATDELHCGDCTTACATGATCDGGNCRCPTSPSAICGPGAGNCCEGTGCCGNACQTKHSNGLGQSYYSCDPLGTYTLSAALAAADAWSAGTDANLSATACSYGCYGRVSSTGKGCAVWCYAGSSYPGYVLQGETCGCPWDLNPTWD